MMRLLFVAVAATACWVSCGQAPQRAKSDPSAAAGGSVTQAFQVKGVIKEIKSDGKTVDIRHEAIPDYMPAMTMPFEVRRREELTGLKAGDVVTFKLLVTASDSWIDEVRKLSAPNPAQFPSRETIRLARNVEPLQVGDPLPQYQFTNELGEVVNTSDLKGQAVAMTFIFTRCPLPNFCPRMSSNFEAAQTRLLEMTNAPARWRLLTISFDPEFDTPAVLKAYAERFHADPKHWSFLTGNLVDITAIAEQFGQTFWREEGSLNHNLRTAVINTDGRIQKIFTGNNWTGEELADELVKAAKGSNAHPK